LYTILPHINNIDLWPQNANNNEDDDDTRSNVGDNYLYEQAARISNVSTQA
jgi:hypothetical protein